MEMIINLTDILSSEEEQILSKALNADGDEEIKLAMQGIGLAAISEYLEMILGKQVPTRANEIMERRLFHLLKCYFEGRIPSESEISAMFQLTETGSRSLLRNVRTRFKFDLKSELESTIRTILLSARDHSGSYRLVIQSDNILEELKQTVSINGAHLDQISRVKGSAGVYNIPEDTFQLLCLHYNTTIAEVEAASGLENI